MSRIMNARDKSVNELSSALPNVGESIQELLQSVIATYIQKQQINGYTQEVLITILTRASIQPFTAQQLKIMPEGQRKWRYFTVYTQKNLDLQPDEIFAIKGINYRILGKTDWSDYGFFQYDTIEDYQDVADESHSD